MNGIQSPEGRLSKSSGKSQECAIEGPQSQGIYDLARPFQKPIERYLRFSISRPSHRPRDFSKNKFTADQVGAGDVAAKVVRL